MSEGYLTFRYWLAGQFINLGLSLWPEGQSKRDITAMLERYSEHVSKALQEASDQ